MDYRGFRDPQIWGEVAKFALHKAITLIAWRKVDS